MEYSHISFNDKFIEILKQQIAWSMNKFAELGRIDIAEDLVSNLEIKLREHAIISGGKDV